MWKQKGCVKYAIIPTGMLQCNTIIIVGDGECAIVDPGGDAARIFECVQDAGKIEVKYIFITHGHFDHILACEGLVRILQKAGHSPKVCAHTKDKYLIENLERQLEVFGIAKNAVAPTVDINLSDNDLFTLKQCCFIKIIHTPGHTPGSSCFLFQSIPDDKKTKGDNIIIATGDTLFCGGIGRTDLPGGDFQQIRQSITKKIVHIGGHDLYTWTWPKNFYSGRKRK